MRVGTHLPLTFPGRTPLRRLTWDPPFSGPPFLPAYCGCPGQKGRAGRGCPPSSGSRSAPTHAPAWSGPCRPRVAAAGHARAPGGGRREGSGSSYLDQLLRGQPWARGGRRRRLRRLRGRGLRLRVMVRVLQLLAGEERRVAGRVRGAQYGLELREHWLVLRGWRLRHGSQAGAHSQHPRGHWHSGGGSGRGTRVGRASHLAHADFGPASSARGRGRRRGGSGRTPSANSKRGFQRRARKAKLFRSATRKRQRPPGGHFLPPRPTALSHSPEPAPATAGLRERAASARTCPATTDTWRPPLFYPTPGGRGPPTWLAALLRIPKPWGRPGRSGQPMRREKFAQSPPSQGWPALSGHELSRAGRPRSLYTTSLTDWADGAGGGGKERSGWNLGREGIRVETWREISSDCSLPGLGRKRVLHVLRCCARTWYSKAETQKAARWGRQGF